jgi:hypothetical protein
MHILVLLIATLTGLIVGQVFTLLRRRSEELEALRQLSLWDGWKPCMLMDNPDCPYPYVTCERLASKGDVEYREEDWPFRARITPTGLARLQERKNAPV